jgi:hypothetical protein
MKTEHHVLASSFADPADIQAFQRCKEHGGSDRYCFQFGDNGIGYWQDDTKKGSGPACALPPDDLISTWGSVNEAKHKPVLVTINGHSCVCPIKDTMPWKKHITNGAGIDLNFDALKELNLTPPVLTPATWKPL